MTAPAGWGPVARAFHWTLAGLILFQLGRQLIVERRDLHPEIFLRHHRGDDGQLRPESKLLPVLPPSGTGHQSRPDRAQ